MWSQKTRLRLLLTTLAFALMLPGLAHASAEIDFTFGFDTQVLRHRFVPFHIQVSGLADPLEGELIVRQTRGMPGSTQFPISYAIAQGTISNGEYDVTLPILEPLNTISIELVDHNGEVIAEQQGSLRLGIREWPFPVVVGTALGLNKGEAVVDSSELPLDWWAYEGAKSVWLLEPVSSAPKLETLGEWVVSGGSLVLFSGEEFPRMDSAVFRRMLPVSNPTLTQLLDGTYIVTGEPRQNATILLSRSELPLLLRMPLGAGSISFVTVRAEDLTEEEIEKIANEVPSANRIPSIEQVVEATLRSTTTPRPPFWVTPVLAVVVLSGLLLFSGTSRFLRPRLTMLVLLGLVVGLTVWSGLYSNHKKGFIELYQVSTSFNVLSSFGLHVDLRTMYSTVPIALQAEHADASYPMPSALATVAGADFSEQNEPRYSFFSLQRNERRDLTLFDQGRLDISMQLIQGGVRVTNQTENDIHGAYLFVGDDTYSVPIIRPGTHSYDLIMADGIPREQLALTREFLNWLPLRDKEGGAWLLLFDQDEESTFEADGINQKVRHVAISLVEGVEQ